MFCGGRGGRETQSDSSRGGGGEGGGGKGFRSPFAEKEPFVNPTEVGGSNARWGRRNRETRSCHLMVRKRVKRQKPRREGWGGGDNQKLQGKIAPPAICPLCAPPARVWFQLARAYGQLPAFYYRRRGVYTGWGSSGSPRRLGPCPARFHFPRSRASVVLRTRPTWGGG